MSPWVIFEFHWATDAIASTVLLDGGENTSRVNSRESPTLIFRAISSISRLSFGVRSFKREFSGSGVRSITISCFKAAIFEVSRMLCKAKAGRIPTIRSVFEYKYGDWVVSPVNLLAIDVIKFGSRHFSGS